MLKNENIICISWLVWDSIPLLMHHMMTRLSKQNRILFVDPPIAYSNLVIKPSMLKGHLKKTVKWLHGVQKIYENFYLYYPPPLLLQYGHSEKIDSISQAYIGKAILKVAQRLGFTDPILWIYHPYAIRPEGQFHEKLVCYDCNDDVAFFYSIHFNKRSSLSEMETALAGKADIVFATSKYLFNLRKEQNPNTHHLPSALDLDLFKKALSPDYAIAEELEAMSKPIIGFAGGISNSKMNWEWIKAASASHPEWNFLFVGPCVDPLPSFITEQKNIVFLGTKPHDSLPSYIKAFDVCLIPYKGEEFLRACQPTKAFEYLAAGKPVVASWIPELEDYSHIVRLSRDSAEFVLNIESALEDGKNAGKIKSYVDSARGYTWDDRVEKASLLIESAMEKKIAS